jgi:hypothetical protein
MVYRKITACFMVLGGSYGSGFEIYKSGIKQKTPQETVKKGLFGLACGAFWPITIGFIISTQLIKKIKK